MEINFKFLTAILVIVLIGLFVYNLGNSSADSLTGNVIAEKSVLKDGFQEINMDVSNSGYSPKSFILKKGIPVKWSVNVKQLTGCNSELIVNDYKIDKNLQQGINTIEFTPDNNGVVTFSCRMGMLRGSFIVTESGTASQEQIAAAVPKAGGSCGAGSGGCGCGGAR